MEDFHNVLGDIEHPAAPPHKKLGRSGVMLIAGFSLLIIIGTVFAGQYYVSHRQNLESTHTATVQTP